MHSAPQRLPGAPLDSDRLDELVRAHQAGVWRYLRFLGADDDQAEDLLQETFVCIWNKPFEERDPASTRGYLCTVARNLFLMEKRHGRIQGHFLGKDRIDSERERSMLFGRPNRQHAAVVRLQIRIDLHPVQS